MNTLEESAFEEETVVEETNKVDEIKEKTAEARNVVLEKGAEAKEIISEKAILVKEKFDEKKAEVTEKFDEKKAEATEKFDEKKAEVTEKFDEKKAEVTEKFDEKKAEVTEKFDEKKAEVTEKFDEKKEEVSEKLDEKKAEFSEKVDDAKGYFEELYKSYGEKYQNGFNESDPSRDVCMLKGDLAENGYDWLWHSFTGYHKETGEAKTFFVEYFMINPALGGSEVIYGQLPENKEAGIKPSYMMVKAGAFGEKPVQLHRFYPWSEVEVEEDQLSIKAGKCLCTEEKIVGNIKLTKKDAAAHPEYMCDGGSMSWDLTVDKQIAYNVGYGASKPLRDANSFEMYWHAEGMKTAFSGTVKLGKDEYEVRPEDCYGYADKNWGKDYTSTWVWLSSNNLYSRISEKQLENSAFDIGGGAPKIGDITIEDKLLGALWYEGKPLEFNFSRPWTLPKTQFKVVEGKNNVTWKVIQEVPGYKMYTSISCPKKDMIFNNYEAPNGKKLHNKLWCGGTGIGYIKIYERGLMDSDWKLVDYIDVKNCGCEYGEADSE